jgi:phosphoglycolate phosphatase
MRPFEAVFFDLDGTLVDTAPDLAYALNLLLAEMHQSTIHYDDFRPIASDGTPAFIKMGFGIDQQDLKYTALSKRYLELYEAHCSEHSTLFADMEMVLITLQKQQIPWGVITNKPEYLAQKVMSGLKLNSHCAVIVGGDTTAHSKPHPAPMLLACERINVKPESCLYIGDAARDIEAGRNVNMTTLAAQYGYLKSNDNPNDWQADAIINSPTEILPWIG